MTVPRKLIARAAASLLGEALADTRVVLVNGARQVGKSTLTRLTAARSENAVMRLLDDPVTLQAARHDPTGFVEHDGLLVIDEIQLAPELLSPIKLAVDLDPTPGRFLLTGSSRMAHGLGIHRTCAVVTILSEWSSADSPKRYDARLVAVPRFSIPT